MAVHQSFRSVSNPISSSPAPSINRKPSNHASSFRSVSPLPPSEPLSRQNTNGQQHYSPLTSHPITPSITPDVAPSQDRPLYNTAATIPHQTPDRPLYASPTTAANNDLLAPKSTTAIPDSNLKLKPLTTQDIDAAIQHCSRVQNDAVSEHGKRPFAALLLGPDNTSVLSTHSSISHYQHAESELARLAAIQYGQSFLERCTLVSTWEPCAMCAGTIYWTGIGRVVYAASETRLKELTGSDNNENMTMSLPCRMIFDAGQRKVEVIGPVSSWEEKVVEESGKWWKGHQSNGISSHVTNGVQRSVSNGAASSIHSKRTSITIYNPDEGLGKVDEDGEYQADLNIDWMPIN